MKSILIIDDDPDVRSIVQRTLIAAGFETRTAGDGDEGLKRFREEPADLAIVDLFMPAKEGIETIMELRQEFPDVKIIAMSGGLHGRMNLLSAAGHLGAHRTLAKPFGAEELIGVVRELLGVAE